MGSSQRPPRPSEFSQSRPISRRFCTGPWNRSPSKLNFFLDDFRKDTLDATDSTVEFRELADVVGHALLLQEDILLLTTVLFILAKSETQNIHCCFFQRLRGPDDVSRLFVDVVLDSQLRTRQRGRLWCILIMDEGLDPSQRKYTRAERYLCESTWYQVSSVQD